MKPKAYIFDIDFTLSYPVNRGPYDSGATDEVIPSTKEIIKMIDCYNDNIFDNARCDDEPKFIQLIFLSGRKEKDHMGETETWIDKNIDYGFGYKLILNDTSPCQPNHIFKKAKLIELQEEYNILGVFDDDEDVIAVCKELKIPSFHFSYNND